MNYFNCGFVFYITCNERAHFPVSYNIFLIIKIVRHMVLLHLLVKSRVFYLETEKIWSILNQAIGNLILNLSEELFGNSQRRFGMKMIESFGCGSWSFFLLKNNVVIVVIFHRHNFGMIFGVDLLFFFVALC